MVVDLCCAHTRTQSEHKPIASSAFKIIKYLICVHIDDVLANDRGLRLETLSNIVDSGRRRRLILLVPFNGIVFDARPATCRQIQSNKLENMHWMCTVYARSNATNRTLSPCCCHSAHFGIDRDFCGGFQRLCVW